MKTNIYIDGFNLYYGCIKGTSYKWLDVAKMCRLLLPKDNIQRIKYFTALALARFAIGKVQIFKIAHLWVKMFIGFHFNSFENCLKIPAVRREEKTQNAGIRKQDSRTRVGEDTHPKTDKEVPEERVVEAAARDTRAAYKVEPRAAAQSEIFM